MRLQTTFDFRRRRKDRKLAKKKGPKPKAWKTDVPHVAREEVTPKHPLHVVLRVTEEVERLRTAKAYHAVRGALRLCAARSDFRAAQVTIQDRHIHLLVEAENKEALMRGMQGFCVSAAKRLDRAMGRKRGTVFAHRYFARSLRTPTEVRNCLVYLFNNWRKHGADRGASWRVDPWSSAPTFDGWATPHGHAPREPLPVVQAQSWLLREGWRRGGGLIRLDEMPACGTYRGV